MSNVYANCLKIVKQYKECETEKDKTESIFNLLADNVPVLEKQYNKFSEGNTLIQNIIKTNQKLELVKEKYDMFYEISEGEIGALISKCDNQHLVLDKLMNIDTDISELSVKIDEMIENYNIKSWDITITDVHKRFLVDEYVKPIPQAICDPRYVSYTFYSYSYDADD